MEKQIFTSEDDFKEIEQWLAQDQQPTQHIDMSDDDLSLMSPDEMIALIKSQAQLIRKQQDTIDWYEADEEESGHE
tara:strand:- start:5601 stop:5828 length:228 start_codon:yes stop_codon:yes gene_type:complete